MEFKIRVVDPYGGLGEGGGAGEGTEEVAVPANRVGQRGSL